MAGLEPCPGSCRARLAESFWRLEPAGEARGPGAAWRFAGRAAWFCQTASSSPPPAPSCRRPRPGRGMRLSPRPVAEASARGGRQLRVLLLQAGCGGLPSPPLPNPEGVVREAAWESASEAGPLGPTLDLKPPQPWVGSSLLPKRLLSFGGPSLALPSQSNRVRREEILTWKRGGDWKGIRARGRLLGARTVLQLLLFVCPPPKPASRAIRPLAPHLGGRSSV